MPKVSGIDERIAHRRYIVSQCLLRQCWSVSEIRKTVQEATGKRVGLTTIASDLNAVRGMWRVETVRNYDEAVAEAVARIRHAQGEFLSAWERSKTESTKTRTHRRRKASHDGQLAVDAEHMEVTKEQRDGNPAYLEGYLRCECEIIKLLGLRPESSLEDGGESMVTRVKVNVQVGVSSLEAALETLSDEQLDAYEAALVAIEQAHTGVIIDGTATASGPIGETTSAAESP